jgi:hypothetical protein
MTAPSSRPFAAGFRTRLQPVCSPFQHQSPPLCRLTATKIAAESPPSRPNFAVQQAPVLAPLPPVSPTNCSRIAARLQPDCRQSSTSPGPLCRLSATKSASFRSLIDPYFAAVLRPSAPRFRPIRRLFAAIRAPVWLLCRRHHLAQYPAQRRLIPGRLRLILAPDCCPVSGPLSPVCGPYSACSRASQQPIFRSVCGQSSAVLRPVCRLFEPSCATCVWPICCLLECRFAARLLAMCPLSGASMMPFFGQFATCSGHIVPPDIQPHCARLWPSRHPFAAQ